MKNIILLVTFISIFSVALAGCTLAATENMPPTADGTAETTSVTVMDATTTDETTAESSTSDTTAEPSMITYKDLTPAEANELIDTTPDLIIIDVSPRYAEGHLPGAVKYYVGDGSLEEVIPTLDKSKPYLVYCHVDSVAILGAQKLIAAGFETVYRLEGNYSAWVDAGYEIE